jgi:hypothetical protein
LNIDNKYYIKQDIHSTTSGKHAVKNAASNINFLGSKEVVVKRLYRILMVLGSLIGICATVRW